MTNKPTSTSATTAPAGVLAIVCATLVVLVAITATLMALEVDTTQLTSLITAAIVPTIASLLALDQVRKTREVVDDARQGVERVEHKVNGRMSELISIAAAAGYDTTRFADLAPDPARSPSDT